MKQWSLRRMLGALLVVAALVTVVIVAVVSTALVRLDDARRDRVDVYGPALLASETLAKAYSDQETGVRGFVASGQKSFLAPYTRGRADERGQERVLRRLLAQRRDLLERVDAVAARARDWQHTVADPAVRVTELAGPRRTSNQAIEEGKDKFDAVRAAVADLQGPLRHSRDVASATLDQQLVLLRLVLLASLVLLVLVGASTAIALRRWVRDPLSRLGHEVDIVERGDLAHAVDVGAAPAEIRMLSQQIDGMRLRIVQEYAVAEQARMDAIAARALIEEQALDLQRSNTELEQFAYVASHDLQEPLRKVASFCQLLERRYKGQLDERADQYIVFAVDGAKRMQQLINDLLAFSRVGRLTTHFTLVNLEDSLSQALRQLEVSVEESGATIIHEPLPTVLGDPTLLVQLFQNLLGNAVKFRGENAPVVRVGVRRDGDMWEMSCADNGIGVEEQYADKIFVIFQRLHGRDVYGGTGIGLAMCKKIVEFHGGRMWLDHSAPEGATFRWTVPVQQISTNSDEERTTDDGVAAEPADRGAVGGGRPW
ncbi:MAG: hypothetical protein QOI54_2251 [Actinomycetota bacterium]|jgi:signal transduction histidine kinase|nr:hypothetical protein [Actinomycetota bacterium]